jgi:hypothetical protein
MDINNLIQTLFFMNIKDISKMSYRELFPLLLISLIYSYKDHLQLYFYKTFNKYDYYKSQISNDIDLYIEEGGHCYTRTTDTTKAIMWKYVNTCYNKVNCIKEYRLSLPIEIDNENDFLDDTYIPEDSTTIQISKDIYLDFIHSEKVINKGKDDKDKPSEIKVITLILKSKTLDIESLKEWLSDINKEYTVWKDSIDSSLKLYTTYNNDDEREVSFLEYNFSSTKTFDNMFFEHKELIIERLKEYENIEKYKKLGIPHTLGFLFHGEPGCGKTSCIKAIANHLNRNIITINLKDIISINQLRDLFLDDDIGGGRYNAKKDKRIYVFEEIDCTEEDQNPFLDRNIKKEKREKLKILEEQEDSDDEDGEKKPKKQIITIPDRISTGEVLELLDGIAETDDRIIIFTTNHPEKIDKAFMRPGRIDMCIEFKKLRRVDINNLYKLWFGKDIGEKALNKIKDYSLSQAEFGKLCFENTAEKVLEKLVNGV